MQVSWCKFEITVESPKVITVLDSKEKVVHPPAVVTAINLKTIVNEKQNISEIVSASVLCFHNAKVCSTTFDQCFLAVVSLSEEYGCMILTLPITISYSYHVFLC